MYGLIIKHVNIYNISDSTVTINSFKDLDNNISWVNLTMFSILDDALFWDGGLYYDQTIIPTTAGITIVDILLTYDFIKDQISSTLANLNVDQIFSDIYNSMLVNYQNVSS